jgi:hypothetical protein
VLAATVPVATEVALTAPVVTVAVVYLVPAEAPKVGPTITSATAPTPTKISAIAANLIFICCLPLESRLAAVAATRREFGTLVCRYGSAG